MNLLAQLNFQKSERAGLRRGQKTPEMIAKRKDTMRRNKIERYRAAFRHFGGRVSTSDLADYLGYNSSSLAFTLKEMPEVRKVDEVPTQHGGRKQFVWEWISTDS